MGIKEIENTIQIVSKAEAEKLDINKNVSILSELSNDKYLIMYSGNINANIKKLYSLTSQQNDNTSPVSETNERISLNKNELRKSGLNKTRTIPSAVHIAAAIASYARMDINENKNIPGNPCIMSDTDSVVLTYPLPEHLVGNEIGQMKLEHEIKIGIFIKKKFYYLLNSKGQEIIKASGVKSHKLNYSLFEKLLKGETIIIEKEKFEVKWKELIINVVNTKIEIKGLSGKIKTIYNTPNVNFKFISFPIKYNRIIHPLYPDPLIKFESVSLLKTK